MLEQICREINNHFIQTPLCGNYSIRNGVISPLSLLEGQRFWIVGSALNDGVYTYHENGIRNDDDTDAVGLSDEDFGGTICAMAVPPAVIALSAEIKEWVDKYGENAVSPYTSENVIGVYSYTKATGSNGTGGIGWKDAFKDRLKGWRKI